MASPTLVWADMPAHPSSAGEARRFVRATLHGWDLELLAETATLLVSELVSNAILHASTAIRVALRGPDARARVRIEVHDGSRRAPARKHYSALSTTGRGLLLVEQLAADWGVEASGDGKQVWFELRVATDPAGAGGPDKWDALIPESGW